MRIIQKLMPASKMKLVISSIGVLALILFSGHLLFEGTQAEVVIVDNDEKQTVHTHTDTVEDLLNEVGITVSEHDDLSHDADETVVNGMEIEFVSAKQISLEIDGDEQEYNTTEGTIGEFLAANNLSFEERDDVSHDKKEAIKDGLHIEVNQAYEVEINDGGDEDTFWTTGGSVEELLAEADIDYDQDSDDEIKPGLSDDVTKDTPIEIVRVQKDEDEVTEAIAFETETKEDSSLAKGEEQVVSEGEQGTVKKIFEIITENGEEAERNLVSEEVTEESENRVVAVGTKESDPDPEPQEDSNLVTLSSDSSESDNNTESASASESESESKRNAGGETYTMSASAYTVNCSGCSGSGYTATGINLNENPKVIAVDPNVIPLGTKVWVEGYGEAIAGDTGGSINGNKIDLHFQSRQDALAFGRQTVELRIID
ncbi:uncharacterized protein YabE (DUF348 family)/3D (Asp-Asp-Asp) domain-containing protein [Virgibacillus natechei]|uniref:Uncharacterized protein YabE (DUF348 family)/3D (Asp-Asp-Asp) domain-containing protein n=1 Tax=Virgibacillus natechei TaxID=1216297 RepID=A0ABS4IHI9_9BACI|nr:G5 and 3D domain-containing protein [Virgibacillus natechei]MBP1970343.1 uncharacterized protein YabE (DUF348 family)/3D (Asp-Asp-Asp) domain-containing protein [Virgibacillus natechei]UZD13170.1 ubiquitin-like domain-containing protein [Virgibacillus natechei]